MKYMSIAQFTTCIWGLQLALVNCLWVAVVSDGRHMWAHGLTAALCAVLAGIAALQPRVSLDPKVRVRDGASPEPSPVTTSVLRVWFLNYATVIFGFTAAMIDGIMLTSAGSGKQLGAYALSAVFGLVVALFAARRLPAR